MAGSSGLIAGWVAIQNCAEPRSSCTVRRETRLHPKRSSSMASRWTALTHLGSGSLVLCFSTSK